MESLEDIIKFNENRENNNEKYRKKQMEFNKWNQYRQSNNNYNYIFIFTSLFISLLVMIIFLFSKSFDIDEYGNYTWTNLSYFYATLLVFLTLFYILFTFNLVNSWLRKNRI